MANFSAGKLLVQSLAVFCCLAVITDVGVEARRGGGGFRGSTSRYRSYRSYRSSNRYRYRSGGTRVRVRNRYGFRGSGMTYLYAARAGYLYGYTGYQQRRYYKRHPQSEPTICVNRFDNTMPNGSYYMYFICPTADQPESFHYCCGQEDRQHCCRFQDDSGRMAGVIIGLLLFIGVIAGIVYCCCCRRRTSKSTETTTITTYKAAHSLWPSRSETFFQKPPSQPIKPMPQPTGQKYYPDEAMMPLNHPSSIPSSGPVPNYPQPDGAVNGPGYAPQPGFGPNYPTQPGPPGYPPQPDGYPPQPGYPPMDGGMYPPAPGNAQPPAYGLNPGDAPYPGGPMPGYPGVPPQPYPGDPNMPYPAAGYPQPQGGPDYQPPPPSGHYAPPTFEYSTKPPGQSNA